MEGTVDAGRQAVNAIVQNALETAQAKDECLRLARYCVRLELVLVELQLLQRSNEALRGEQEACSPRHSALQAPWGSRGARSSAAGCRRLGPPPPLHGRQGASETPAGPLLALLIASPLPVIPAYTPAALSRRQQDSVPGHRCRRERAAAGGAAGVAGAGRRGEWSGEPTTCCLACQWPVQLGDQCADLRTQDAHWLWTCCLLP